MSEKIVWCHRSEIGRCLGGGTMQMGVSCLCPLWDKDKKQCSDVTNRESLKSIAESLKDLHVGVSR